MPVITLKDFPYFVSRVEQLEALLHAVLEQDLDNECSECGEEGGGELIDDIEKALEEDAEWRKAHTININVNPK